MMLFINTKVKNKIVGNIEIIMPNMIQNVNNSGFFYLDLYVSMLTFKFMNTITWTQKLHIHMA